VTGGEETVAKAFAASAAVPVVAPVAASAIVWPYTHFGKPGVVESRREVADLGATQVRFANGVSLTIKPTDFRKDQIMAAVDIGHGREDLPSARPTAMWSASALVEGGFGALTQEDSQRALAGHVYDAGFAITDDAFQLHGTTRPQDLATQMQVLAAYVADPGFRPEAFERLKQAYLTGLPQLAATPGGVVQRDAERLLHDGDLRWEIPTEAELAAARPDDLKALLQTRLAKAPIEITIVGDVTVDDAIAQVAATFGALPPRPASMPTPVGGDHAAFPAPTATPVKLPDGGRPDQAMAIVAWPLTDFYENMQDARADMLAGEVLEGRVIDRVRIAEGATYSPETQLALSETFPHYGVGFVAVEMPPQKIPNFFAEVSDITANMAEHGVTADELERARNPRVATIRKSQLTNEYWLARLEGSIAEPRRLDIIRTTLPDYAKVTAADVQAAAKRYLVDGKAWKLVVEAPGSP